MNSNQPWAARLTRWTRWRADNLLIASRVMLLTNSRQHTGWILLQHAEELKLINQSVAHTVKRGKDFDLQIFRGDWRKFEFLMGSVEALHILGLKFSNRLEKPGGRFVPL